MKDDEVRDSRMRAFDEAFASLRRTRPDLAGTLIELVTAIAAEAGKQPAFASALAKAAAAPSAAPAMPGGQPKRPHRRAPGVLDPFAVFADGGDPALRSRLENLSLDQLRDIV